MGTTRRAVELPTEKGSGDLPEPMESPARGVRPDGSGSNVALDRTEPREGLLGEVPDRGLKLDR
jgi:hypothetical protein